MASGEELIKKYFTKPPRFEFVKLVGQGTYAQAFQIRFNDPDFPDVKNFIVKKAFDNEEAVASLREEKEHLLRLSLNQHLIAIYDWPDTPLASAPGVDRDSWLALEWLPNGTVHSFIKSARRKLGKGKHLPNRLLWRFFLCLVRGCIAIAFPDSYENIPVDAEVRNLSHNDIHFENVLLGEPLKDNEHRFTPILKLIDFGMARYTRGVQERQNVEDIGEVMMHLISLRTELLDPDAPEETLPKVEYKGQMIKTDATQIVPFKEGIDPLLLTTVCACMSSDKIGDKDVCPNVRDLFQTVYNAAFNPDKSYRDNPEEQDEAISKLWKEIVNNAN